MALLVPAALIMAQTDDASSQNPSGIVPADSMIDSVSTTVSEDFESGLTDWTRSGNGDWGTRAPAVAVPGSAGGNSVAYSADCDQLCVLTLTSPVNLSGLTSGHLVFDRFIDIGFDTGEYLRIELYDGTMWRTIFDWQANTPARHDDSKWHTERYELAPAYLVSDVKMRITAKSSYVSEVAMIDNVSIGAPPTTPPAAPTPDPASHTSTDYLFTWIAALPGLITPDPAPPTSADYSIYVADNGDGAVSVHSKAGSWLGHIVPARAGGLGAPWDVAFGPDGHLYVSDNTHLKIRKYNGATGAPMGTTGDAADAEWASTSSVPYGMAWKGTVLYVASSQGVERFSLTGASMGYFGDAARFPPTQSAPGLFVAYDVAMCPDSRMYVADRAGGRILYYSDSTGSYQGEVSGTPSDPPNTGRPHGVLCGEAVSGTGTSLYQSGGDRGRINEIDGSTKALVHEYTSLIDEPYGMVMDGAGSLYVVNKDDENVVKITPRTSSSVFASGGFDDPRGITVGHVYSAPAPGAGGALDAPKNSDPEFVLVDSTNSTVVGPITLQSPDPVTYTVRAADAEGDAITLGLVGDGLPEGVASIIDHGNGTATVTLSRSDTSAGAYVFWITASDAGDDLEREPYGVIVP